MVTVVVNCIFVCFVCSDGIWKSIRVSKSGSILDGAYSGYHSVYKAADETTQHTKTRSILQEYSRQLTPRFQS